MAIVEKVSVSLTAEMLETVKEAVAGGGYASASEVIGEALREWHLRQLLKKAEVERLRKAWDEGIQSGTSSTVDFDEIKRRGRERLASIRVR